MAHMQFLHGFCHLKQGCNEIVRRVTVLSFSEFATTYSARAAP